MSAYSIMLTVNSCGYVGEKNDHLTQTIMKIKMSFFTEYFPHIGRLNQLLVLCQQLEDDIRHLGSHKYIAHQLSVIYVSSQIV